MRERVLSEKIDALKLTADIVSAFVSNNSLPPNDIPGLFNAIHQTIKTASEAKQIEVAVVPLEPAVPIKKSVTPDFIVCLEDGKKFKSMRRHLDTAYNMTPEQYRMKWKLPADYPMVAPAYAAKRSALAKAAGLGVARKLAPPADAPKARKTVTKKKAA